MTGKKSKAEAELILPESVPGRVQLARMIRELEALDNEFELQKAHSNSKGAKTTEPYIPAMSQSLTDFVELNKVDILNGQARMQLKRTLNEVRETSPTIHFTFAAEADPQSLQQLVAYVRKEIHSQALVSVGLQPALVGGAYVRTPNQVHDFSLKARLQGKRDVMIQALAERVAEAQAQQNGQLLTRVVEQPVRRQPSPGGWPDRRAGARPAVQPQPMSRQSVQPVPARRSHAE